MVLPGDSKGTVEGRALPHIKARVHGRPIHSRVVWVNAGVILWAWGAENVEGAGAGGAVDPCKGIVMVAKVGRLLAPIIAGPRAQIQGL